MLANQIYKNIKEGKKENERRVKRDKVVRMTTLTALGVGAATIGATVVYKKAKSKQEEYYGYNYNPENYEGENNYVNSNNNYELKAKVDEFNSNRLSYDNENHSSTEEMSKFLNKTEFEDNSNTDKNQNK